MISEVAVEVVDRMVEIPGGSVFVRRWEAARLAEARPLILLHDSLGCVGLWRDFPAALAQRLRRPVVAYDRLGYGQSSARTARPSPRFIAEEAEEHFAALARVLEWREFDLFGHSVGGAMAVHIAARSSGCRALITESAQAFVEERTLAGILQAKAGFADPGQFERLEKWHGPKARWVLDAWTESWLSPDFADWSLAEELPRVTCPLLAIHGDLDEFGSVSFPKFICEHTGGRAECRILESCGHVPHRERREEVLALTERFLGETGFSA